LQQFTMLWALSPGARRLCSCVSAFSAIASDRSLSGSVVVAAAAPAFVFVVGVAVDAAVVVVAVVVAAAAGLLGTGLEGAGDGVRSTPAAAGAVLFEGLGEVGRSAPAPVLVAGAEREGLAAGVATPR
jgi:hypothetical protein